MPGVPGLLTDHVLVRQVLGNYLKICILLEDLILIEGLLHEELQSSNLKWLNPPINKLLEVSVLHVY